MTNDAYAWRDAHDPDTIHFGVMTKGMTTPARLVSLPVDAIYDMMDEHSVLQARRIGTTPRRITLALGVCPKENEDER